MTTIDDFTFSGFNAPQYTQIPDIVFDELMHILSGAEFKILMYILRRTFGFKKNHDSISYDQIINGIVKRDGERLDYGAGVKSRASVSKSLKRLEELNIIVIQRASKDGVKDVNVYAPNMGGSSKNELGGSSKNELGVVQKMNIQETVQKREGEEGAQNAHTPSPHSLNANKKEAPSHVETSEGVEMVQALSDVTGLDAKLKRNRKRIKPIAAELLEADYTAEQIITHYGNEPTAGTWHYSRDDWRGAKKGERPTLKTIVETIGATSEVRRPARGSNMFDGRSLSEWWDIVLKVVRGDKEAVAIFQSSEVVRHAYDAIGKSHGVRNRDDRTQAKFNKAFVQFSGGMA